MWYTLPDSTKQYPLTIERVRKIKSLNQQGVIVEELEAVDITTSKPKEITQFVELVGQISLQSLEKADKKKRQQQKSKAPGQQQQQRQNPPSQRGPSQPRSQQNPQRNQQRPNQPPQKGPDKGPQQRGPQQPNRPQQRPPRQSPGDKKE